MLLFLSAVCLEANAQMNSKLAGNSIGESFVYKSKKAPKSISSKDRDVLTFLKFRDNARLGIKSFGQRNIEIPEVFTLETVNGDTITNVDVINVAKLLFFFSGKQYDEGVAKMMFPAIIVSLEDSKLREQCAKLFAMRVSENDINNEIARLAQLNGIDEKELEKRFISSGLSMRILRKHIKSRIIFQMISQSLADESKISKSDLDMAKQEQRELIASKRYYMIEIFRYDRESAERIRKLALKGFDFQILAENLSQGNEERPNGITRQT